MREERVYIVWSSFWGLGVGKGEVGYEFCGLYCGVRLLVFVGEELVFFLRVFCSFGRVCFWVIDRKN